MYLILCALSVFTMFAYADPHLGQLKQVVGKALQALPKKLPYSSSVPFWQYTDVDPFLCEQSGYFPDIGNCRYYYQCVAFMPGHLVRYVYQCDEDHVYSDQDKNCVIPSEDERAKCSAEFDKEQDTTSKQTTVSNEDIDMSLLTEQPFIIDTVNDTETTDTKNVTSITISGELDYNKKNTYLDKGLNYETISKIVNAPTESEANRITKIVEDSTESEAIGITTVPSSTEPDAIDITTVPGSTTEPVTVTIGKITETAEDSMKQETIQVTTASGSTEQEAIEITTVPDSEESETIEIPATFPSSTTIEPTRTVQDSTESEEIGFTTFPSSTEPDEMAITKTGYEQSECVNEGFFGDSENCSKFYRCVQFAFKFIKYEFFCPRGTIWDDRLKTCNFRAAVKEINCKDLNKYPLFPFAEQNAVNPVDNLEDRVALVCPTGFRQHPNYCNAFYQCIVNENLEYHLTVFLCPVGSIFDQDNIRCSRDLSIQRNSCVNLGIAEKQLFSRILKHSEITMCPTEGQFQYGGGCASDYLYCKRDQLGTLEGYLFHCPRGQLFSPIENKCVSSTLSSLCN